MSASKGSGAGNGGGHQSIPMGSRKMVQSLKEIVNFPEAEIYVTLKDCNMDPNETVNRLLGQDPFHEVKSKREKKKEGKDTTDSRPRGNNSTLTRSSKSVSDRYIPRSGLTPYNSSESSSFHGKLAFKKDNDSAHYTKISPSTHHTLGNNRNREPGFSDGAAAENKISSFSTSDGMPSGVQTPGYQSAWVGVTGQLSMADIVKMGKPPSKPDASQYHAQGPQVNVSKESLKFPEDHSSKVHEPGVSSVQHASTIDEWPSIERRDIFFPEYVIDSELHPEMSSVPFDGTNQLEDAEPIQETRDETIENHEADTMVSHPIHNRKTLENHSRGASLFEDDLYENMGSYLPQNHDFEYCEAEEVGASFQSVTRNLQHLSVNNDSKELASEGDTPSVVIPDHLQVNSADCSHLSFGSFRSGMIASYSSGTMSSVPVIAKLEEACVEIDTLSRSQTDTINSEYFAEESLRNASDGSFFTRNDAHGGSYGVSSASQPEELKPENTELAHVMQYPYTASNPGYNFDDARLLNVVFSQTSSQMENLTPFSNVMHSYTNTLPSNLLAATVPVRESDIQLSQFSLGQSMPSKYGVSASSMGGSAISFTEAMKTGGFSSTQPSTQNLSGSNVVSGPPLQQNLAVHPYSQPTLPLGPYGNLIGYPILPQTHTYMPSAFQQAFVGNNTYHQSLAAMLPQYKNSVSVSSLPQSGAIASGYGSFGSTSIPGNFSMNPSAVPAGTPMSYDDPLNAQYKDSSHLISLQQSENSALWLHGPNSRTMSSVPLSTYYNYQGQSQQPSAGFRQAQQPSQNYGALVYPNFYHSQAGMLLDQQQSSRDGPIGSGSQGQPKQSQIWHNSY